MIDYRNKRVTDKEIARFYRYRDRSMRIEMESNCFNAPFIHILADVFPRAQYVLTLRPFRAWLGSWINHTINRPEAPGSIWLEGLHALYQPEKYRYGAERAVFEPLGLFPIRCYMDFWLQCNARLLNFMPPEQMMVTLTPDIDQRPERLARFLDISCSKLDTGEGHRFRAAKDHKILDQIDHPFLEDLVAEAEAHPSVERLYALAR